MKFAVLFEDAPDTASIRRRHLAAHLEFLKCNSQSIQAVGPLLGENAAPTGGLWLVNAETSDDVMQLVEQDPFWPTGLRQSVRIRQWVQVFANGQVQTDS